MEKSQIMLLGGGGFLGRAIAKKLCLEGRTVHVISPHSPDYHHENMIFHQGSLDNKNILKQTLPVCDDIIHVASTTTPGDSINDPTIEVAQNMLPTIRFMDYLTGFEDKRMIYVSSGGAVYDPPKNRPIVEEDPLRPLSYYGAGKLSVEFFLRALSSTKQQRITILRPSNLYGPFQAYRKGFGLIRTILERVSADAPLEIWGDGEIVRDYLYIDDMVDLIGTLLESPSVVGVYNIGSGTGHSINQVIDAVETVCMKKLKVYYIDKRSVDIESVILDISKIRSAVPWEPRVSIADGIQGTWNWLQSVLK